MSKVVIKGNNLKRSYQMGNRDIEVLKGLNLEISAKERVFLCGASGAGKTTLMYTLAGLEKPQEGSVEIDGIDLYSLSRKKQAAFRNEKMGYIFQNYFLLPELTALENVMVPSYISGKKGQKRAEELLETVGLAHRLGHLPTELSGGEQQRVAIARSLMNQPKILFADEPTGNLDSKNGSEVIDLLLRLVDENDSTLVVVTHDQELSQRGDRRLLVKDGRIDL